MRPGSDPSEGHRQVQIRLKGIGFFKSNGHDITHAHNELNQNGVFDGRPFHSFDLLDDIGPIQNRSLFQFLTGVG